MVTVGGVVSRLLTITVTGAEVAVLPAASRATAVSVWVPFGARVVVQATVYGGALTSAPRLVPSSLNCTPATPTLSEALADTVTVPVTVAPLAGAVKETAGGVVSFATVTLTAAAVAALPVASRATAVKEWEPLAAGVVFQEMAYG